VSALVTILADNRVDHGDLLGEHGFSLLVESDAGRILFDAGQTEVCLHNARRLGADLSGVSAAVLSHGHYDHGGGLAGIAGKVGGFALVAHPDVFAAKYARRPGRQDRYVGLSCDAEALAARGVDLRLEPGPLELGVGLVTTGPIPRTTDFEHDDPAFWVKREGQWLPDRFDDEQALVLRTGDGIVVLAGCSHTGIINALRHAIKLTGDDRIRAVVGGFHLASAEEARLDKTVAGLRELEVGIVVACHCTGFEAKVRLDAAFGERFVNGSVGFRLTL
jgi:7,8-dihydropterin-6-yl-methyl-4-(beta-D-ribofuranosyl)aminobenzene 5'-phosphate synthase